MHFEIYGIGQNCKLVGVRGTGVGLGLPPPHTHTDLWCGHVNGFTQLSPIKIAFNLVKFLSVTYLNNTVYFEVNISVSLLLPRYDT